MRQASLPICPSSGSIKLKPNGPAGSSRYATNTTFAAWACECGKSFTVGEIADNPHAEQRETASTK
jgi:hypothetical protein